MILQVLSTLGIPKKIPRMLQAGLLSRLGLVKQTEDEPLAAVY